MITKITDNIFLGNREDARDINKLQNLNITCCFNVAIDVNYAAFESILSVKCGLHDSDYQPNRITEAVLILDLLLQNKHSVLVHCYMGHNRSPYIVAKYMSIKNNCNWVDCFNILKLKRPEIYIKQWMV